MSSGHATILAQQRHNQMIPNQYQINIQPQTTKLTKGGALYQVFPVIVIVIVLSAMSIL